MRRAFGPHDLDLLIESLVKAARLEDSGGSPKASGACIRSDYPG